VLNTNTRKQTQITQITHEPSYKQTQITQITHELLLQTTGGK